MKTVAQILNEIPAEECFFCKWVHRFCTLIRRICNECGHYEACRRCHTGGK